MANDDGDFDAPTRREYLKYGSAVVGGGLLAGCTGQSDSEDATTATQTTESTTTTETETTTSETETTTEDQSYSVEMAPVGELTFEEPPEKAVAYWSTYGDMLVALGQSDAFHAAAWPGSYPTYPYEEIPGIDFSPDQLESLYADGELSKELLFEMDPDIIHFDPNIMQQWFGFDDSDIEEISENVAPFAANYIRRKGDEWHDYPYYSLYEAFEKIAKIYQQQERYEAFKGLHDEFIADIQSRLPPEDERPAIALITIGSDTKKGDIVGLPIENQVGKKQYYDLGVKNAFAELETDGAFYKVDYEGLLEVDPEIIVVPWGLSKTEEQFETNFLQPMKDDAVGSEVSAVKNDRVFRGGVANQGPIVNLVNTEIAAQQLYPDVFGDENLFDRQRVADIVNGDF